ncbi:Putative nuclease HARBI1 [Cyphomyrmex costatus]|uniref:Putative nuclease HARBI1 n=1 Tax=Cyphomyrmex costatus TaxID=456900 RepID=A0A151IHK8_9HYME|nr:Putative nuclease HARBI1 [Cyphomyrmex costatus]
MQDAINPFTAYREHEFHIRYRFSKHSVMHGLPLVIDGLRKPDKRSLPIEPVFQLLICLRFYVTASLSKVNGDLMELPQSTISRIMFRVTVILAAYLNTYVKFPTNQATIRESRGLFKKLGYGHGAIGLPCIDGAIDYTHAVVGLQMEFLDLVPEWPGSQHDSRVLRDRELHSDRVVQNINVTTYRAYGWSVIARREAYTRLRDQCINAKNAKDYKWVGDKFVRGLEASFGNIAIDTYNGKKAEVVMIDDAYTFEYIRMDNTHPIVKRLREPCDDRCMECEKCIGYQSYNKKVRHLFDMVFLERGCRLALSAYRAWSKGGSSSAIRACRKERAPFVVYADLKCVLRKTEDAAAPSSSYAYERHEVCSIAYYMHCSYDGALSKYRCRRDNDCVSWFARQLETLAHRVKNAITTNRPMDFTRDDWRRFDSGTHCHICEKPFAPGNERARDHCHLTGRYRGPAHKGYNVNYKDSLYIPVVFHNLSGYDAHFVIHEIATQFQGHVDLLPLTKEKYISFTKHVKDTSDKDLRKCVKLRFIDSYKGPRTELMENGFRSNWLKFYYVIVFAMLIKSYHCTKSQKSIFPSNFKKLNETSRDLSTRRTVMSLTLTLSGRSSVLAACYFPAIDLSDGDYELGQTMFETYHTIPNVNDSNDKFYFGNNNEEITIPKGLYELRAINEFLKRSRGNVRCPTRSMARCVGTRCVETTTTTTTWMRSTR